MHYIYMHAPASCVNLHVITWCSPVSVWSVRMFGINGWGMMPERHHLVASGPSGQWVDDSHPLVICTLACSGTKVKHEAAHTIHC